VSEAIQRAAIAAEARTWLGTPYAHRQRLKGVGCDCAGLPLEIYAHVGLIPPTDVGLYSNQWHLHRSKELYLEWVERFSLEIPLAQAQAGDFLIWRFGRTYSHGGILVDDRHVVHAYARVGKVILDNTLTQAELKSSPVKAFTFSATAVDQANINAYGRCQQSPQEFDSVCLMATASTIAQLMVQRSANVRRTAQFTVSELFGLLDPMDLITVPLRDGGDRLVRIIEANEQADGSIQLQVEEMLVGAAHAAEYTRQDALGIAADFNVDPGDTFAPAIINPPLSLTNGANEVWIAASGGPLWGGCVLWASFDGDTYQSVGTITAPGRYGVTTTDFPASGGDPDTTDTLGVTLAESGGTLTAGTQTDADGQVTLCAVGTEIIAYSAATLTAANTYTLGTYIRRGLEGTTIADQPAGSLFMRLDGSQVAIPYNAGQVGKTLYVKLQSFNLYGGAYEDLDLCTAYEFTAEPNGTNVSDVTWATLDGVPSLLTDYVSSGGVAVNTANVGTATAAQIEALPTDVANAVDNITTNTANIALNTLTGAALASFMQAQTTLSGEAVGTVLQTYQASQNTTNAAYAANFTLLGAKNSAGTAWQFNGGTVLSDGVTTLSTFQTYVENVLGTGGTSIASILETTNGLSANITLSANSNGQVTGLDIGTSGLPNSGYFDILTSKFRLIDTSSGQTLVPLSYTAGTGWVFNADVAINGDLLVAGTVTSAAFATGAVTTGAIDPFSITNTAYTESAPSGGTSLGGVGSAAVELGYIILSVSGAPLTIDVLVQINNTDGSHDNTATITLTRDGTQISDPFYCFTRQNSSGFGGGQPSSQYAPFYDAGALAGYHTYRVYAQFTGGVTSGSAIAVLCRIIIQDLKTEA
jgi:NlpC/P60 family putative phage cell wall peptidase